MNPAEHQYQHIHICIATSLKLEAFVILECLYAKYSGDRPRRLGCTGVLATRESLVKLEPGIHGHMHTLDRPYVPTQRVASMARSSVK